MVANKVFLLIICLLSKRDSLITIIRDPMHLKGRVEMVDVGKDIPIRLTSVSIVKNKRVAIIIQVDGQNDRSYLFNSNEINNKSFAINAFRKPNQCKEVKIIARYYDDETVADSVCIFNVYSPGYKTYHLSEYDEGYHIDDTGKIFELNNVIATDFDFMGTNYQIIETKEKFISNANLSYHVSDNRFIDFSHFKLKYENTDVDIDFAELRIYKRLEQTDIFFKENSYHTIDLNLRKISNEYYVVNENRFYVDKFTGMVQEKESERTNDELLQFFIPFSVENEIIYFEIVFYDLGYNHSIIRYMGTFNVSKSKEAIGFGMSGNYRYVLVNDVLDGVSYA